MVTESETPDTTPPRYSPRPFPSYRFVPGQTPHPRRTSHGHSYGQPEAKPTPFPPDQWQSSEAYRYGIDLYNHAYWWESHEIFEGFWHMLGHDTEQGTFFRSLIQLAAANLKGFSGNFQAAENLMRGGLVRLQAVPGIYMGIDVTRLTEHLQQRIACSHWQAPSIRLAIPGQETGEVQANG